MPTGSPPQPVLRLRPTTPADLAVLFEFQCDPDSNDMAGTKPRTREGFTELWQRIFADPGVNSRVIEIDGERGDDHAPEIVGSISRFQAEGNNCVGYWIGRRHWGKGFASRALALFIIEDTTRPLHATAASDNACSRHILEKCGFRFVGCRMGEETDRFTAREIADYVLD